MVVNRSRQSRPGGFQTLSGAFPFSILRTCSKPASRGARQHSATNDSFFLISACAATVPRSGIVRNGVQEVADRREKQKRRRSGAPRSCRDWLHAFSGWPWARSPFSARFADRITSPSASRAGARSRTSISPSSKAAPSKATRNCELLMPALSPARRQAIGQTPAYLNRVDRPIRPAAGRGDCVGEQPRDPLGQQLVRQGERAYCRVRPQTCLVSPTRHAGIGKNAVSRICCVKSSGWTCLPKST